MTAGEYVESKKDYPTQEQWIKSEVILLCLEFAAQQCAEKDKQIEAITQQLREANEEIENFQSLVLFYKTGNLSLIDRLKTKIVRENISHEIILNQMDNSHRNVYYENKKLKTELAEQKKLTGELVQFAKNVSNQYRDTGRPNSYFNDTQFESEAVVYGYNLALEYMQSLSEIALTKYNESIKK